MDRPPFTSSRPGCSLCPSLALSLQPCGDPSLLSRPAPPALSAPTSSRPFMDVSTGCLPAVCAIRLKPDPPRFRGCSRNPFHWRLGPQGCPLRSPHSGHVLKPSFQASLLSLYSCFLVSVVTTWSLEISSGGLMKCRQSRPQHWPVSAHPPRADLPCCDSTSARSSPGLDSGGPTGTGDGGQP